MTSSQTLTMNLFAPLAGDLPWMTKTLVSLGLSAAGNAESLDIEHGPAFHRAGHRDRTLVDAFIRTSEGGVVVETKLADQFSRRTATISRNPFYQAVNDEFGLWDRNLLNFDTLAADQLARVHALGALASERPSFLLFIHHPLDHESVAKAETYRATLQDPSLLRIVDLGTMLAHLATSARTQAQQTIARDLEIRYVAHDLSEEAYQLVQASPRPEVAVAVAVAEKRQGTLSS